TGEVMRMQATTSIIARKAVFSRGSWSAGAIWLIDSSPENASHELPNPTRIVQGLSLPTAVNWCMTRSQCDGCMCTTTTPITTRFTTSDATAIAAVTDADSRMPI